MSSFTPRGWKSHAEPQAEHRAEPPVDFPRAEAESNNLPVASTTFIGREHDVAEVKELLEHHRLVSIVGSGGVGKTRLAIESGAQLLDRYPDGIWFVDFAPITDPELVASVIAQVLDMNQQQGRRVDAAIPKWLRRKRLLLIFDNCEQVLETVAALADAVLSAASGVRILSTSRQALDIGAEVVYRLPSLSVDGAVTLFVARAKAADTRFVLTDETAPIVAEICRHLDGIPLAIELAAARVKVLSIPNLAQRLTERFKILTGGSRSALPRQKTLTALIDWSYDLLTPHEQLLFARLGVFAGGFGLDAVTTVCCGEDLDEADIFDLMTSLIDKSLVVADTSGERERYRLLESTAAYAFEKLTALGEREQRARRHAEYFRDLAEATRDRTSSIFAWRTGVDLELDNYRASLEWALTHGNDSIVGGAMAGALGPLWFNAGLGVEGRYWTELALQRVNEVEQPRIAARLYQAHSQFLSGKRAYEDLERARQLSESAGDVRGASRAQQNLAFALFMMGRFDEASAAVTEALSAWQDLRDEREVAGCIMTQAAIEWGRGNIRGSRDLHTRAISAFRALDEDIGEAIVRVNLAELESADGHPEEALRCVEEALEALWRGKNANLIATALGNRGSYRIALGDIKGARESVREALRYARRAQNEGQLACELEHIALLDALEDDAKRAAQLLGYVDAELCRIEQPRTRTEKELDDKLRAALRERLSEDEIKALATEGAAWSEDRAIAEAMRA